MKKLFKVLLLRLKTKTEYHFECKYNSIYNILMYRLFKCKPAVDKYKNYKGYTENKNRPGGSWIMSDYILATWPFSYLMSYALFHKNGTRNIIKLIKAF